ncbi:BJ4_G0034390.mRNA.1.CDS.1 [Saccharomyces cerevisiae]|nr:BJ4_G0034390.mRNA.1.CDS.1 [Saccharomyces cerevisiae]
MSSIPAGTDPGSCGANFKNDRKRRDKINDRIQELLSIIPKDFFRDYYGNSGSNDTLSESTPGALGLSSKAKGTGTKDGKPNKGQILTQAVEYISHLQNQVDTQNREEVELMMKATQLAKQTGTIVNDINLENTSAEVALSRIGVGPLAATNDDSVRPPAKRLSSFEYGGAELSSIHAKAEDEDELTDPLEKKHAVKLIKDLQKAINKVLSTRLRLPNFNTIDHFTATLRNAKKILVLTGAGVSTSLGIPDFRSSEGFYSKIRHLGLEDPQDVFNLDIFLQDPSVFYNIAHMVLPPENMYSPLHSFIKMLQDKGKLLRNYTQNIDNLESYAGIDPDKLVQCHGSFATASCVTCHWQIPGEKIFENIRNLELPLCPYCYQKRKQYFPMSNGNNTVQTNINFNSPILKSYGVLKPDMTFFGEALPSRFHKTIRKDILECDLLICIGTSLKVAPVSEIVNMVPSHVPQILINRDMVTHAEFDLNLLGFCDDVASLVAKKCHWDIPHKKWQDLKKIDYNCTEIDKGTYKIKKQPRKKQQ